MVALVPEFAASGLRRFVRLPSGGSGAQTHSQRLAAAAAARSRTAACLAFPAVALVLYLAVFGLPGRPSRSAATVSALDGSAAARSGGIAEDAGISDQRVESDAASKAVELLQQPRAKALWSASSIPDVAGRKSNLLRGDSKALCAAIAPPGAMSLAVVGNGPLTDESRRQIAAVDVILRFNEMNNRLPDERLDVWISRHNYRQPAAFWGFWQLQNGSAAQALIDQAHAVLLLGGTAPSAQPLLTKYSTLEPKLYQADTELYQQLYQEVFGSLRLTEPEKPDPSTGLLGLLQVLACAQAARKAAPRVHVHGFNWSGKHWMTHQMKAEEEIVRRLAAPFSVEFHPAACAGLRSCDPACDTADYQAADPDACRKRDVKAKAKHELAADAKEHVTDTVQEAVDMLPA